MTAAQDRRSRLRSRLYSWATEVPLSWSVERAACGGRQLTQAGRGPAGFGSASCCPEEADNSRKPGRACGSRGRPRGGRRRATSRGPSTHLKRRRGGGDSVAGPEGVAESVTAAQDQRGLRSRMRSWATEDGRSWLVGRASCCPEEADSSRKPEGLAGRAGRRLRGGGPCVQLVR